MKRQTFLAALLLFLIPAVPGGAETYPVAAYDAQSKQYLVVYEKQDSAGKTHISGQIRKVDGTTGVEISLVDPAALTANQYAPHVAFDSVNRRFLVVWEDYRNGTVANTYGQLVDSVLGQKSGANLALSSGSAEQSAPHVAYDHINQRYLLVWEDYNRDSTHTSADIYGQMINSDGSLYFAPFAVSNAAYDQSAPNVAFDPFSQQYLVVWQDRRSGINYEIYGQLIGKYGNLPAGKTNFRISSAAAADKNNRLAPSLACDLNSRRYLVTWDDPGSGTYRIAGQLLEGTGAFFDVNFTIVDLPPYKQYVSSVDVVNDRFLVAWGDYASATAQSPDLYGRFVDGNRAALGSPFLIQKGVAANAAPKVVANSTTNNFLVAFQTGQGTLPIDYAQVGTSGDLTPEDGRNGKLTIADALKAAQLGVDSVTEDDLLHGDVGPYIDGKPQPNNTIDITDAVVILKKQLGLISW